MRELGRRSEAAGHPFCAMRPDEGGATTSYAPSAPPGQDARPLVLADMVGRRQLVTASCAVARALGLTPGMALTHARALVPELEVLPADPTGDVRWLERLAQHAVRHWTPTAAVDQGGLALDLTGTTHLFGGEEQFARRVLKTFARLGFSAQLAIAPTYGAAFAVAAFGQRTSMIVPDGAITQAIGYLPVAALRLDDDALVAARQFGFERVADLLALPRGPLARRLGRRAIMRLDQALGHHAEPIDPVIVDEQVTAERSLLEPVGTPDALGQVMNDLAADLAEQLRERALGVRALGLTFLRVDGDEQRVALGTSTATRDPMHLARLLRLRLEQIDPGMGIETGRLVATRTEPLGAIDMGSLLSSEGGTAELAETVDQLASRTGASAIFRVSVVESDVPERAVERVPAVAQAIGWPAWSRPTRLLTRPELLYAVVALLPDHPPRRFSWRGETHVVAAGDGPERIHGEWWVRDGETWAVRDYFRVEDTKGGRYWIFRRGDGVDGATGDLSWWMHGAFG